MMRILFMAEPGESVFLYLFLENHAVEGFARSGR